MSPDSEMRLDSGIPQHGHQAAKLIQGVLKDYRKAYERRSTGPDSVKHA
jgi:hypothetical protein